MKKIAIVAAIFLTGCASTRNVHFYPGPQQEPKELAIIAVQSPQGPVLTEVDGKSFENFVNGGLVHRVFLRPGSYEFTIKAVTNATYSPTVPLPNGSVALSQSSFDLAFQKISATVEAGHAYDFSNSNGDYRKLGIRDLGKDFKIQCLDPRYTRHPEINPMLNYDEYRFYKSLK